MDVFMTSSNNGCKIIQPIRISSKLSTKAIPDSCMEVAERIPAPIRIPSKRRGLTGHLNFQRGVGEREGGGVFEGRGGRGGGADTPMHTMKTKLIKAQIIFNNVSACNTILFGGTEKGHIQVWSLVSTSKSLLGALAKT